MIKLSQKGESVIVNPKNITFIVSHENGSIIRVRGHHYEVYVSEDPDKIYNLLRNK